VTLRRFSPTEYERLVASGVFAEDEPFELLDGYLVLKMPKNPPHDACLQLLEEALRGVLPSGWCVRNQSTLRLPSSRPEPDLCIVRGNARTYVAQHPEPADVGLLIEVADSSPALDRTDKARLYAQAGIPEYWIVNVVDRQIEVYSLPTDEGYAQVAIFAENQHVPFVLDGVQIGIIPVAEVLP
jgi:Uma2 family endonuclease